MHNSLRYRKIHLDFHTSEHIPDVGKQFDKKQFIDTLKAGNVNSVTLFAKCHHGWSYYPTKVGSSHPNLKRANLLGEMVEACRENDITTPIYISVQWDEKMSREHPEWRVCSASNRSITENTNDSSALNQLTATWHTICLNNDAYIDYLLEQTLEVIDLFNPAGLFMDIILPWECVCQKCLDSMAKKGLDPENKSDRQQNERDVFMRYYRRMYDAVKNRDPNMRIFHNSGHIFKGERDRYTMFSHLELESLPTGGWGYDNFPISSRYVNTLGIDYLGMTGKFHTTWGEFGGFKRPEALEYECTLMAALGARCSVGDQLHPNGLMNKETYKLIAPAYKRIAKIEEFLYDASPVSEIAILSSEAHDYYMGNVEMHRSNQHDVGVSRMLLEMQLMFDIIDCEADFSRYKLLIFPDTITLSGNLLDKTRQFIHSGGKLLLTGASGMKSDKKSFAINVPFSYTGEISEYNPDFIKVSSGIDSELVETPFVMYEKAYKVKGESAQVLAAVHSPYFNRSYKHFSSHQHAPYRPERNSEYDAMMETENIVYISYPIFLAYDNIGQPLYKYLIRGAVNKLLPKRTLKVEMPSSGRVSLMEQKDKNRLLLHLLYAQPQLKGKNMNFFGEDSTTIEIIEDIVPIHTVSCTLRLACSPKKVYIGRSGECIAFSYQDGVLSFILQKLYIHEMIVIDVVGGVE